MNRNKYKKTKHYIYEHTVNVQCLPIDSISRKQFQPELTATASHGCVLQPIFTCFRLHTCTATDLSSLQGFFLLLHLLFSCLVAAASCCFRNFIGFGLFFWSSNGTGCA